MERRNAYAIENGKLCAVRIVTEQKGSWKWQDAFRTAWYCVTPRKRRSHGQSALIWKAFSWSSKYARTRGRGDGLIAGSLHNRPVTPEQLQALALLEEMIGTPIGVF